MISDAEEPNEIVPNSKLDYVPIYSYGTSLGMSMSVWLMLLLTFAAPIIAAVVNARTGNAMAVWLILTVGVPHCPRRLFLLMVLIGVSSNNFGIR